MMRSLLVMVILGGPLGALAWGGRGHHSICSAAVHLVQDKNLSDFLKFRPHIMGHLCNVPDIYWKSLPATISKSGNPAHYIDPEVLGLAIKDIPADFLNVEKNFTGKSNKFKTEATIFSVPEEVGSLWWRADQFNRRIVGRKEAMSKIVLPKGGKEEQDDRLPYNKEIYDMTVNMGIMGHFIGDVSQPLHSTADHDGWAAGHGGLHSYYEELSVSQAPEDLEARIVQAARRIKKADWLEDRPIIERMRFMSEESAKEIPKLFAKDPIKKKSEIKSDKGMEVRTPPERESNAIGWKKFESMIIGDMARSARLLAALWDKQYAELGKPDLSAYRSYHYPLEPDFVAPDYTSSKAEEPAAPAKK